MSFYRKANKRACIENQIVANIMAGMSRSDAEVDAQDWWDSVCDDEDCMVDDISDREQFVD
jgi:hypothetical protein